MISLGTIRTEERDGETVIPDEEEDKLLTKLADKLTEKMGTEVEVQSDSENPGLEDIWLAGQPLGKIVESNRKTAKSAEKQARTAGSSASEPTGNDGETGSEDDETTTLDRIADDDTENPAGVQIGPSVERAAAVMKNWENWSKKAPKGRNIRDGLKTLLETATGESLAWRQVYRACKKVEQLTKGKIVFTKTEKHGWMLLQPNGRASSVANR